MVSLLKVLKYHATVLYVPSMIIEISRNYSAGATGPVGPVFTEPLLRKS